MCFCRSSLSFGNVASFFNNPKSRRHDGVDDDGEGLEEKKLFGPGGVELLSCSLTVPRHVHLDTDVRAEGLVEEKLKFLR